MKLILIFLVGIGLEVHHSRLLSLSVATSAEGEGERELFDAIEAYTKIKVLFEKEVVQHQWEIVEKENHVFHVVSKNGDVVTPILEARVKNPLAVESEGGQQKGEVEQLRRGLKARRLEGEEVKPEEVEAQSVDGEVKPGDGDESTGNKESKKFVKLILVITNRPKSDPDNAFLIYKGRNLAFQRDVVENKLQTLPNYIREVLLEYSKLTRDIRRNTQPMDIVEQIEQALTSIKESDFVIKAKHVDVHKASLIITSNRLNAEFKGVLSPISDEYTKLTFDSPGSSLRLYLSKFANNNIKDRIVTHFKSFKNESKKSITDASNFLKTQITKGECQSLKANEKSNKSNDVFLSFEDTSANAKNPCPFKKAKIAIFEIAFGWFHYFMISKDFPQYLSDEIETINKSAFENSQLESLAHDKNTIARIQQLQLGKKDTLLDESSIAQRMEEDFKKLQLDLTDEQVDQMITDKVSQSGGKYIHKWSAGKNKKFTINLFQNPEEFAVEIIKNQEKEKTKSSIVINLQTYNSYDSLQLLDQQIVEFVNRKTREI